MLSNRSNEMIKPLKLPRIIKVRIIQGKSGAFIAELPEYGIHTEADSRRGLDYMINDLIYAYFDVPKKYWGKIWYKEKELRPEPVRPEIDLRKLLLYQKYIASDTIGLVK